ncbi:unnamed protein product [Caenorhabditis brenneri]
MPHQHSTRTGLSTTTSKNSQQAEDVLGATSSLPVPKVLWRCWFIVRSRPTRRWDALRVHEGS